MADRLPASVVQTAKERAVLRRTASAADVASQVVAFCQSDSVTGQVLTVDGGVYFH